MQEGCATTVNNGPNMYPIGAHYIIKNILQTHNGWGDAVAVLYKTNDQMHDGLGLNSRCIIKNTLQTHNVWGDAVAVL